MYPLLSTPDISMLRVSGGTVFFRGFRDSMVFIFLVVLHIKMNLPVLLWGVLHQFRLRTNVSKFDKSLADNILYIFMCITCLLGFPILFRVTVVLVSLL